MEDSLDKIVDIGDIENISYRDFAFLVPKVEVETKVATMALMNSNYSVGVEYTSEN